MINRRHFPKARRHKSARKQTNGAPGRITIALSWLMVMALTNIGKAQIIKLHPLTAYETSLRTYYTQKVRTQCAEFQARTRMKWWYYLPNVGFQFGLPSINAGSNQLVQVDQTRQQNRVKLAAILSQGLLDYRTDLHQLRTLYSALQVERATNEELLTSWQTQDRIFQIAKEAHEKKEIKPVDYYQALLTLQRESAAGEARNKDYALKVIELARFARFEFPHEESLPELDSLISATTSALTSSRRRKE